MPSNENNNILLYQADDGQTRLEVHLEKESVWLTQAQLANLFAVKTPAINKHLKKIFLSDELQEKAVISILETTAADGKNYKTKYYNLDVIIAVGYRVNSYQATRFRQWATQVLRDHLVEGYTIHEQRLRDDAAKFSELQQTVDLLTRTLKTHALVSDTGEDVLRVISDYAYALATLDRYDHGSLIIDKTTTKVLHVIDYEEGIALVRSMKGEFNGLFGIEKDQSFTRSHAPAWECIRSLMNG